MISDTIIKLLVLVTSISSVLTLGVEVEDVTGKQLEAALQTEELLAVMFCEYQIIFYSCKLAVVPINHHFVLTHQHRPPIDGGMFSFQCYPTFHISRVLGFKVVQTIIIYANSDL